MLVSDEIFQTPGGLARPSGLRRIPRLTPSLIDSASQFTGINWCACCGQALKSGQCPGRSKQGQRPALSLVSEARIKLLPFWFP